MANNMQGLKSVQVIRITFCLGQVGLTRFTKYLGLTRILYWIMWANNGISVPDHSSELSVCDSDNGSISPNSPQDILMD